MIPMHYAHTATGDPALTFQTDALDGGIQVIESYLNPRYPIIYDVVIWERDPARDGCIAFELTMVAGWDAVNQSIARIVKHHKKHGRLPRAVKTLDSLRESGE